MTEACGQDMGVGTQAGLPEASTEGCGGPGAAAGGGGTAVLSHSPT